MVRPKLSRAGQERLVTVVSPIVLVLVWEALSRAGTIDARYVPSPLRILESGWLLVKTGELWLHLRASLYRLAVGFMIGAVPGVAIGMVMGLNRFVRATLDPIVAAVYPIPKIAVLPLLMLVFGIGDGSKIAAVAISVAFLTIINTMAGVMNIDPIYFDVARNYNTPWRKLFLRVIIPASLPTIFAGLRISIGMSLIVLVGAEFVASRSGIGYLIWSSWQTLLVENMFVGIIIITLLGIVSTFLLKECERFFIAWRRD
jgi:NitT/TauT family transport system permease protein